jgi:pimeloyl-ACP methyl ester carboxylesterase
MKISMKGVIMKTLNSERRYGRDRLGVITFILKFWRHNMNSFSMWSLFAVVLLLVAGCAHQTPITNASTTVEAAAWRDPSPHRSGFIAANGIRLHYLDWGGNGEAIVLLAGLGNTAHVFDDLAPRLSDQFRVYALTRRGYGQSDHPKSGCDTATLVEDLRAILDTLGIERVNLVGHSFAGDELSGFAATKRFDASGRYLGDVTTGTTGLKILKGEEHPAYDKIAAPALALYAVQESIEQIYPWPFGSPLLRLNAWNWYTGRWKPFAKAQKERFEKEVAPGRAAQIQGNHYLFLSNTEKIVELIKSFLIES